MENNRNGSGVFYGVIGVATLIVTIIGATFAFFNASTQSANDAVQTTSSTVQNLSLELDVDGKKTNLIPALETAPNFGTLAGKANTEGSEKCKDAAGNFYCSIYSFTITNPNAQAQPIYVHLDITENTFGNLWFAVFKDVPEDGAYAVTGSVTDDGGSATAASTAAAGSLVIGPTPFKNAGTKTGVTYTGEGDATTSIALDAITQLLGATGSATDDVTYTMIVWIHDNNQNQNTTDANKSLKLGVRVATGADANSGITAVLGQS